MLGASQAPHCDKLPAMKPKKKPSRPGQALAAESKETSARVREEATAPAPDYATIITIEPGKRGGKPCIRGMRITVGDVLGWLAAGMSEKEILHDFPDLTAADIRASLAYAAERENKSPKPTAADGQRTNLPAARLKQMRGFLRGIDTAVPREFDRV